MAAGSSASSLARFSRAGVAGSLALAGCAAMFAGCSTTGVGEGSANGLIWAPDCGLNARQYDLNPTFFVADPTEGRLEIRVQRGSDVQHRSDGLSIFVADAADVQQSQLGMAIQLTADPEPPVRFGVFFNETCPFDRDRRAVHYVAVSGTILFRSIYAPDRDESERETRAEFTDVQFVDPTDAETRRATLSGEFRFLFSRGRPAQRFP